MIKRYKTSIIIGAVIAGFYLAFTLLSQFVTQTRSNFDGSTMMSFMIDSPKHAAGFRSPSRIAIVTPPTERRFKYIQAQTARALRERLSQTPVVCSIHQGQESWNCKCPEVAIFTSKQAAKKNGYSYMIRVQPQMWRYSMLPFSRSWKTEIVCRGEGPDSRGPRTILHGSPDDRYGNCGFNFTASLSGKMTGIFSTSHLTKTVAQHAADDLCEMLQSEITNRADKVSKGKELNPQWHEPAPGESTSIPTDLKENLPSSLKRAMENN